MVENETSKIPKTKDLNYSEIPVIMIPLTGHTYSVGYLIVSEINLAFSPSGIFIM